MKIKVFIRAVGCLTELEPSVVKNELGECVIDIDRSEMIPTVEENTYIILITDDADLIRMCFTDRQDDSKITKVYVGDVSKVSAEDADEFWPASADGKIISRCFAKLIDSVITVDNAFMYRQVLMTIIDSVPDLVWMKDIKGAHLLVNQEFCRTVHKTREDIHGRGHYYIWDITPEEYSSGEYVCMESEEETMKAGRTCVFDEPLKTSEGMKQLKTYKTPVYDNFGIMYGTVGFAHDVTNFTNMGIELDILIENIPVPLILCDINMRTLKVNDTFRELVGISKGEIIDYPNWKSGLQLIEKRRKAYRSASVKEYRYDRAGQVYNLILTEHPITDHFGNLTGYFILIRDISFERKYEESMLEAAYTDGLTGLFNRRYFYDYISENASGGLTLLYMDLDRFKYINDNYGHARGDEVLIKTADIIKNAFPEAVNSRLGGDEFATIITGDADEERLKQKCSEIEKNVKALVRSNGPGLTISIGIARTSGTDSVDSIIHEGDRMMYETKKIHHKEAEQFMASYDPNAPREDRRSR